MCYAISSATTNENIKQLDMCVPFHIKSCLKVCTAVSYRLLHLLSKEMQPAGGNGRQSSERFLAHKRANSPQTQLNHSNVVAVSS